MKKHYFVIELKRPEDDKPLEAPDWKVDVWGENDIVAHKPVVETGPSHRKNITEYLGDRKPGFYRFDLELVAPNCTFDDPNPDVVTVEYLCLTQSQLGLWAIPIKELRKLRAAGTRPIVSDDLVPFCPRGLRLAGVRTDDAVTEFYIRKAPPLTGAAWIECKNAAREFANSKPVEQLENNSRLLVQARRINE